MNCWKPIAALSRSGFCSCLAVAVQFCTGCGGNSPAGLSSGELNPYLGYVSQSYTGTANWLCHPDQAGTDNICGRDITAILVEADGSANFNPSVPAANPKIDCFFLYGTVSDDAGTNSDFQPGIHEIEVVLALAARYREVCRVFAPIYRQVTLSFLVLETTGSPLAGGEQRRAAEEIAYRDVLDAFREYMAHHNQGRGFILVGHSQGSRMLSRLIAEVIEQQPYLSDRHIAAHIPGEEIVVPVGQDVGVTFARTPACRSPTHTGCVIAYSSYRKGDPELANPAFGIADIPNTQVLCINPAALNGGAGTLELYAPFRLPPIFQAVLIPRGSGGPYANPATNVATSVATAFYSVPGQISGECIVNDAGTSYLEITISSDSADPRADDYPGEFVGGTGWGMHLADVPLTQGNLVRLAYSQSEAWLKAHPESLP